LKFLSALANSALFEHPANQAYRALELSVQVSHSSFLL
jgi:hypothetical protein